MRKIYILLAIFLAAHLAVLSRLQFTAWPEMLSFPYMIDKGFLIYRDFHHVYQPLLSLILLLYYKFAGLSPGSLKIFTWISILIIDLLIFAVSRQLFKNKWISLIPLGIYIILQPLFEGNMMWFDIAMVVPLLLSVHFVFRWSFGRKSFYIFISGLLLTTAFLIKQQAVLAFLPFIFYLWTKKVSFKEFVTFAAGISVPLTILLVLLILTGNLKDYFFWTFQFPLYWLPKFPGYKILPIMKEWFVILLMILAPVPGVFSGLLRKKADTDKVLIYGIFLMSLVSAFPRFSFFHLQPFLAFFVIAVTFLILQKNKLFAIFALLTLIYISIYRWRLILPELGGGIRFYGQDEIQLAGFIDSITLPNDKIYLLGPNSAIYVYANRIPPKPWIENYVWHFEIPGLQEKVLSGWIIDSPKYIFWTPPIPGNWFDLGTYQPKEIVKYIHDNYKKIGQQNGVDVWKLK